MKEKMQHRQDEEKQDLTKMWKLFHKNGKKKKNTKNREFAVVTYSFLGLFLCLMGYFVYFEQVESEQFINNPYNKRQELFTRSYRGKNCMVTRGLDYYHCKGCLRCVEVCPTGALVPALEKDYPEKPHFLPNQHLLPDAIRYQTVGANSWITSDSFTDEKRVDGGVV